LIAKFKHRSKNKGKERATDDVPSLAKDGSAIEVLPVRESLEAESSKAAEETGEDLLKRMENYDSEDENFDRFLVPDVPTSPLSALKLIRNSHELDLRQCLNIH
jgi:hypothetical protein